MKESKDWFIQEKSSKNKKYWARKTRFSSSSVISNENNVFINFFIYLSSQLKTRFMRKLTIVYESDEFEKEREKRFIVNRNK